MHELLSLLEQYKKGFESFEDKLNKKYTVGLLLFFAFVSTARLYISEPISCFCPSDWSDSEVAFAEQTCWTQSTFYVPMSESNVNSRHTQVSYYQWMSLIFTFQAFLFFLPGFIWKLFIKKCGVSLDSVAEASSSCRKAADVDDTTAPINFVSHNLNNFLRSLQSSKASSSSYFSLIKGRFLSISYLFVKCLYLANVCGQLYFLEHFLGNGFHYYGWLVVSRMFKGKSWSRPQSFPRVTFCNVMQRVLGNTHRYIIQCTLPMNLYYEMMMLFLWFWLVIVMFVTFFSVIRWSVLLLFRRSRVNHLSDHKTCDEHDLMKSSKFHQFVDYMHWDGFLMMKMIEGEGGKWVEREVVQTAWSQFLKETPTHLKVQNKLSADEGFGSFKGNEILDDKSNLEL